jgi:two-component system NarL family sensor kinase
LTFHNACNGFVEQHTQAVVGILQEALSNIVHHAAAENADIICRQTADRIEISVLDDGCGFDLAKAYNGPGLGLQAMRWRAMAIGGRIAIAGNQPNGAKVTLVMPCSSK